MPPRSRPVRSCSSAAITGSPGSTRAFRRRWTRRGSGTTTNIRSWRGAFLSATSSFFAGEKQPLAQYGLYASNTSGPGLFTQVYANNMGDAAFYIGACPDCNTILDHAHGQNSAEG